MQGGVDTAAIAEVLMGLTAHSLLSRFLCTLPTVESLGFLKKGLHCPETSEISVAPPPLSSSRTLCFPFLVSSCSSDAKLLEGKHHIE